MWSRSRMYSSGRIWQSIHFPAERNQTCEVINQILRGKEWRCVCKELYISITWCHNPAVYESENEPCKNAPTDCDIMPSGDGIAHQKNARIHSDHQTCEDHCANIPQTKYFAWWIYSAKRWGGHEEIADEWLIHSRWSPYCDDSPFEKRVTYSLSVQFRVSLRKGCTHVLENLQCKWNLSNPKQMIIVFCIK